MSGKGKERSTGGVLSTTSALRRCADKRHLANKWVSPCWLTPTTGTDAIERRRRHRQRTSADVVLKWKFIQMSPEPHTAGPRTTATRARARCLIFSSFKLQMSLFMQFVLRRPFGLTIFYGPGVGLVGRWSCLSPGACSGRGDWCWCIVASAAKASPCFLCSAFWDLEFC